MPGASAAVTALAASGLPSDSFYFAGFLPAKPGQRLARLEELAEETATLIFYEAPHRVRETLEDMQQIFGDREACVARELTKIHEEYLFGRLSHVTGQVTPLGEFVIIIAGGKAERPEELVIEGLSRKDILKLIAEKTGISKKRLYDALLKD